MHYTANQAGLLFSPVKYGVAGQVVVKSHMEPVVHVAGLIAGGDWFDRQLHSLLCLQAL